MLATQLATSSGRRSRLQADNADSGEMSVATQRLHQAIEPEPLKLPVMQRHRWHSPSCDAATKNRLEAKATFIFNPIAQVSIGRDPDRFA
ncbi:MAG: hypothetical protein F6K42_26315 [Leptolyngbya sp. SIO1D8]|nr:hypothetical protein [Leptolyngbya sp. SIO1D8]